MRMTHNAIDSALSQVNKVVLGKQKVVKLCVACMLAKGHLLIEDLPGVGKTTLAQTLARTLGLDFQRVQFTSDMLPADIIGTNIFDRESSKFNFHQGPIFNQFVLADEVNRATPRTQSALLEAMEEYQVSIDGATYALPTPFFVIATQNPSHQVGTYPLPESQLDRFMMGVELGYPDQASEKALLMGHDRREMLKRIAPKISVAELNNLQQHVQQVHVSESLADYIQAILQFTRESGLFVNGLSPRSGLALLSAARAWAFIEQREQVIPEDVQAVLASVVSHRLQFKETKTATNIAQKIISSVPIL